MSDCTENHTLHLLQEMRKESREGFASVIKQFEDVNNRFEDVHKELEFVNTKLDGNTLTLSMMMGYIHNHKERIVALEDTAK